LSGRGLCDEFITRPEESYRLWCVVAYDLENLVNEEAMTRVGSHRHRKKPLVLSGLVFKRTDGVRHDTTSVQFGYTKYCLCMDCTYDHTGCPFHRLPAHRSCHQTTQLMQAVYAT